ncbi:hypothetical protein [Acinetobacter sp. c3-l95]|uniref:hypothetical protein n=1 Tax=Acinetobacter sp. c3-l95 TaxID=3342804 RepID=UPI0035B8D696
MQKSNFYLSSQDVNVSQAKGDEARQFTGVANSGKPFSYEGQRAIVDLSTLEFHPKIPALLLHDREQRVGFGALRVENHQLLIGGTLLKNAQAQAIASEADNGFPWQMSAHVQAGSTEELTGNQTAEVNGQTVTAPILILRHCKIPEVSFTPTGVDSETSAVILSDEPNSIPSTPKGHDMNETEQLKAKIAQLEADNAKKDEIIKQLQDEKQKAEDEAKKSTVEAELSAKGFSKNDKGEWQDISSSTVNLLLSAKPDDAKAMIGDLAATQAKKPAIPEMLLGEQYGGGQVPQSTSNPLLDNAVARSQAKKNYL